MPSRFSVPPGDMPESQHRKIDTDKRYDVYCLEYGQASSVHRNVLFKGTGYLFEQGTPMANSFDNWIELVQPNSKSVYISRHQIKFFCEHGTEVTTELLPK